MNGRHGMTIVEVLVALGIVAVAVSILFAVATSVLQQGSRTNFRTQAGHFLNYFGRSVAGGNQVVLPDSGETLTWTYGELADAFPDLPDKTGVSDLGRYRVAIAHGGAVEHVGASVVGYEITICTRGGSDDENCLEGLTLGPEPESGAGSTPVLPGIN